MSDWTHALCDTCWVALNSNWGNPHRVRGGRDRCCGCGHWTTSGIYYRADPSAFRFCAHDQAIETDAGDWHSFPCGCGFGRAGDDLTFEPCSSSCPVFLDATRMAHELGKPITVVEM